MTRRNRTPEENERRAKIRELLQIANIGSMKDVQELFKETIAEFMENGLEAELHELGYSKCDYKQKTRPTAATDTAKKTFAPVSGTSSSPYPGTEKASSNLSSLRRTRQS